METESGPSIKRSFEPVAAATAVKLILGSLPGEESLRQGRYYAHPANHFWRLVFEVHGEKMQDGYEERLLFLQRRGIALWDVLRSARRRGSLDQNIRCETPNDFDAFFRDYPGIRQVYFNGTKARDAFKKHAPLHYARLACSCLPSSSPIPGRGRSYPEKLAAWSALCGSGPGGYCAQEIFSG